MSILNVAYAILPMMDRYKYDNRHMKKRTFKDHCTPVTVTSIITVTVTATNIATNTNTNVATTTTTPVTTNVATTSTNVLTTTTTTTTPVSSPTIWVPNGIQPWFIQYTGNMDYSKNVNIYNIDLFDTTIDTINTLHNRNVRVICYFSAGTYENWRPDANLFLSSDLGKSNGWVGENWLDIRSTSVRNIMKNRILLAKQKKCDGVDPDNVDGYSNDSGFPLTSNDQLDFDKFLATTAHENGLSVSLKNNLDQIPQLVNYFDYAVNEQCLQYNECSALKPFTDAGKTVFHIEYSGTIGNICLKTRPLLFSSVLKNLNLDATQSACQ
jgi:hypothetical protein